MHLLITRAKGDTVWTYAIKNSDDILSIVLGSSFLERGARTLTSAERTPCLPA